VKKRQVVYFFLAFMRRFMPDFLGAAAFLAFIRRFAMVLFVLFPDVLMMTFQRFIATMILKRFSVRLH
jgi:hypothetical protein